MDFSFESRFGKKFAADYAEFEAGLKQIEEQNRIFFKDKRFESYYTIVFPPEFKFGFNELGETLPENVITQTRNLYERIFQ